MVETYSQDEQRFYYVDEAIPGTTPTNPAMLSVPCETINPGFNPSNLLLRGSGNYDLLAIKKGTFAPDLRIGFIVPSAAPINLLQYAKIDLNKTLNCQILYHKGTWASPTDILSLIYAYMRVSKVSVSCEIDDVVKATMDLMGQSLQTGTAKITGATYTDYGGAIAHNETDVSIDSTPDTRVVGWRFDISNHPRRVPVIRSTNGHLAKYVPFGRRELSGEVRFEFESKDEMDDALADTEFDLKFGLSGTNHATFPDCKWSNVVTEKWLDDLIVARATWDSKGPVAIATS